MEEILRDEAKKLLDEKKVDVIIGYEEGTVPLTATPCFITEPEDVKRLVFNPFCRQNIAKHLINYIVEIREFNKRQRDPSKRIKKRFGIVAKGCVSRSIVLHLLENQYKREDVVIIGVPCKGMVDLKKVERQISYEEILEGRIEGEDLLVKTRKGETKLSLEDALMDNCKSCISHNPPLYDIFIGEKLPEKEAEDEFKMVEEFESKPQDERWAYFEGEMSRCIRCYACRNACPSCYCKECILEQTKPKWFGFLPTIPDTELFHIVRIFHMAGRCVDCGSCVAACPMDIDLRLFLKKLDKDVLEIFNYRAGISLDVKEPLACFSIEDWQGFLTEPEVE